MGRLCGLGLAHGSSCVAGCPQLWDLVFGFLFQEGLPPCFSQHLALLPLGCGPAEARTPGTFPVGGERWEMIDGPQACLHLLLTHAPWWGALFSPSLGNHLGLWSGGEWPPPFVVQSSACQEPWARPGRRAGSLAWGASDLPSPFLLRPIPGCSCWPCTLSASSHCSSSPWRGPWAAARPSPPSR